MKKHHFNATSLIVLAATLSVFTASYAADLADASGALSDIASMSVQSKATLAEAALSGDVDAIAEAVKRSDAVDAAMGEGMQAYSEAERANAANDADAADSAIEDLEAARTKAQDALNGVVTEPTAQSIHDLWKKSQENAGGGPRRAYDPPNIYDVPWQTAGLRQLYQDLFGNVWGASSFGGNPERDATPE
jgi:hypothetical protein